MASKKPVRIPTPKDVENSQQSAQEQRKQDAFDNARDGIIETLVETLSKRKPSDSGDDPIYTDYCTEKVKQAVIAELAKQGWTTASVRKIYGGRLAWTVAPTA